MTCSFLICLHVYVVIVIIIIIIIITIIINVIIVIRIDSYFEVLIGLKHVYVSCSLSRSRPSREDSGPPTPTRQAGVSQGKLPD